MERKMNPLISVIVPVYNVEEYLDRCVESIVNQTYKNLEIILVDDGSTDSSGQKCDEWKARDDRIVVKHKKNGGQASARNEGLRIAKGEFIGFVDSDDCIDISMYESMHMIILENDCDIVECSMKLFFTQSDELCKSGTGEVIIFNREEAVEDFIRDDHLMCTVPNMLLKSEIATRVMFDEGRTHEDILWPYRAYSLANKIVFIDRTYYFYYQRSDSTMNITYSSKRFDGLDALEKRAELVKTDFPGLYNIAARSYLGSCMYQYQFLCRQPKSEDFEEYKKILHNRYCSGDIKELFNGVKPKYKFWNFMLLHFPNITCKARNTLKIGL